MKNHTRNTILASVASVIMCSAFTACPAGYAWAQNAAGKESKAANNGAAAQAQAPAQAAAPAQEQAPAVAAPPAAPPAAVPAAPAAAPEQSLTPEQALAASQNVTLDFKDADINNVLKILSYKSGLNIVTTPDVTGTVTIKLVDVAWDVALDIILKTYGYGFQRQGNVILVTKVENISKIQSDEPLQTEIVNLKFLDAQDAQKILIPLLSNRGKITVLYSRAQKGWQFGSFQIGKATAASSALKREEEGQAKEETISVEKTAAGDFISRKASFDPSLRSKIMIITDTAASLDRVRNVILPMIDKKPKQVLIETRLIEVSKDKLKDIGFDWGLGATDSAQTSTVTTQSIPSLLNSQSQLGGHILGSQVTPSAFTPKEGTLSGVEPYNMGAEFIFKKIAGTKMEAIVHALDEDVSANTLSAPKILTLDNQEASILVGFHTPILLSSVTAPTTAGQSATVVQTLDYYQEIGIRLNVIPQVNEDGYIRLMIHPSVSSTTGGVNAVNQVGGADPVTTSYPIIDVREAQTQVLIKDGETIVIGGLLKDVKTKQNQGIPFLNKIPILKQMFNRETNDTSKIDLLIFISARVIKDGDFSEDEIMKIQDNMGKEPVVLKSKKVAQRTRQ